MYNIYPLGTTLANIYKQKFRPVENKVANKTRTYTQNYTTEIKEKIKFQKASYLLIYLRLLQKECENKKHFQSKRSNNRNL